MNKSLGHQVAVVTGSSRGIGRAIAEELSRQGAAIIVHGFRSKGLAEELVTRLQSDGREATAMFADLSEAKQIDAFIDQAFAWRGHIHTWVNNAGFDALTGDAVNQTWDEKLERLWHTDVLGTMRCSRLVGERMKAAGSGQIVNIGWDQAWEGMEGDSGEVFAAVKGAIMAFTKSCAKSLAPEVRVNCVAPGWIKTEWGQQHASTYWHQRAIGESLRGRWGTPEDVARAVAFLSSPAADFINGHILPVNGGFRSAVPKSDLDGDA